MPCSGTSRIFETGARKLEAGKNGAGQSDV